MSASLLPAYGWTEHSEQTDAAALEAHAWRITTTLLVGQVVTAQLKPPSQEDISRLEAIAEHRRTCKNPLCNIGLGSFGIDKLCPNGKYDPTVTVFMTYGLDAIGRIIHELRCTATSVEEAVKNHYGACALLTGALSWGSLKDTPA